MEPSPIRSEAPSQVRVELPAAVDAPAAARRALGRLPLGALREDALLLASELVTHAVNRAPPDRAGTVLLEAELGAGGLRVEVRDGGARLEPSPEPDYGMRIVAGAAHRWGIESDRETRAWFELDAARA